MGIVLIAGVTGLLLRQLMSRKLGAAESYQQMAETAALNGFNRILSELNNDDSTAYKGYLFTLDHHEGDIDISGRKRWGWNTSFPDHFTLKELCTNRKPMPDAVPAGSSPGEPLHVSLTESTASQREDGKANIQLHYRLRGYTTTATAGNNGSGTATFEIEGLVSRDGDDPEKGYLSRTLLLRSLYVNSIVAGEGDWAVLAGQTLNLRDTEILKRNNEEGDGKVLVIVNDTNSYFKFDPKPDNELVEITEGCSPGELLENIGASSTNDNLENRIIPIFKTGLPGGSIWNLGLTQDTASDSDKIRIWSFDDTDSLGDCEAIACSRDSDSANAEERNDLEEDDGSIIRLSANELCKGSGDDCHIFVEHINLTRTRLLIETSASRPVVLHLEYPGTSTESPSEPGISGSINLGSSAKLCGVNAGSTNCNGKPEQLIIFSAAPKPTGVRSCSATPATDQYVLMFDGESLPHATVHLIPGIVKAGKKLDETQDTKKTTKLNGLIWADAICTEEKNTFSLTTDNSNGSSVVRDLHQQWDWNGKNFSGYGQMVTRGIRGTGLDTFRRW